MSTGTKVQHKIVSQELWLTARKELLAAEKEFTRQRDALSAKRRELPWVKVEKNYIFDSPNGKVSFSDLFRDKSQLIVYHFMLGPGWEQGCPSCSFLGDHFDGSLVHLNARDVAFAISRATMPEITTFKNRIQISVVSSNQNEFNFDHHVSFTKDQRSKARSSTTTPNANFQREAPRLSVSQKRPAKSSIPIPPTPAAWTFFLAPTTSST
jgi:predicted dithiol-disulfide oxidoreductase (DUF899 family)